MGPTGSGFPRDILACAIKFWRQVIATLQQSLLRLHYRSLVRRLFPHDVFGVDERMVCVEGIAIKVEAGDPARIRLCAEDRRGRIRSGRGEYR